MNNSKKILLSTIMTAIFLSGCSEEKSVDDVISTEKEVEVTVVKTEKVEEVEEVKEVTSPKPVETVVEVKKDDNESLLKEFTTYSDMDVTANNPELQKLIDQTIQEYESFVVKIIVLNLIKMIIVPRHSRYIAPECKGVPRMIRIFKM